MKALAQEVTANLSKRLNVLGIQVKELTGDMQLSKKEIADTQILVVTPEKLDVITRKSGDSGLMDLIKLLIIDEVHLLHEERGPVIEILVARTLRRVESSQQMCRIVGLSATLPNYVDVAVFLGVNLKTGLFYFDSSYRPVPLSQCFVGIQESNPAKKIQIQNELTYKKVIQSLEQGYQCMIFVHSRRDTVKTARILRDLARENNTGQLFVAKDLKQFELAKKRLNKSRNTELIELFDDGLAMHNAGMIRSDRNLVEKFFLEGLIRVLVCTATLAW
jgi:activating signal cointegrator complex subunit 3